MGEETWVSYTTEFPDWDELSKRMLPLIAAALDAEWTMEPVERFNAVVDKSKLEFVLTPIKYWRFHMRPKVAPPPTPDPEPTLWWLAALPPFKVKAHIPCSLYSAPDETKLNRVITDGRVMDVFSVDASGWVQVLQKPALWAKVSEVDKV